MINAGAPTSRERKAKAEEIKKSRKATLKDKLAAIKIERDADDPQPVIEPTTEPAKIDNPDADEAVAASKPTPPKHVANRRPTIEGIKKRGAALRKKKEMQSESEDEPNPDDEALASVSDDDVWDSSTDLPDPIVTYQDQADNLAKDVLKRDEYIAANPEKFTDAQMMTITPGVAASLWARRADQQRPVNRNHVSFLSRQMSLGHWRFNGDTIRLNEKGALLDGQHRMLAIIDSGVTMKALLVTVSDKSFETIDTGMRVRAPGELLRMNGETNHLMLAAALACMSELDNGRKIYQAGLKHRRSPLELQEMLERFPTIRESVAVVSKIPHSLGRIAMFAAIHYLFAMRNKPEADRFFEDLISGAGLAQTDPVLRLRERLAQNNYARAKAHKADIYCWFVHAWNARLRREGLKNLRGQSTTGDPEIQG